MFSLWLLLSTNDTYNITSGYLTSKIDCLNFFQFAVANIASRVRKRLQSDELVSYC